MVRGKVHQLTLIDFAQAGSTMSRILQWKHSNFHLLSSLSPFHPLPPFLTPPVFLTLPLNPARRFGRALYCYYCYCSAALKTWDGGRVHGVLREKGLGRRLVSSPAMGSRVSPPENFWVCRCKSVRFGAFLATSATEMYNSVFNLDFGRSIWWHQVIKSATENRQFIRATFKSGTEFTVPALKVLQLLLL